MSRKLTFLTLIVFCLLFASMQTFALDFENLPTGFDISVIPNNYSIIQAGETDGGIDYIVAADTQKLQSTVTTALKDSSNLRNGGYYGYYNYTSFKYYTSNSTVPTVDEVLGTTNIASFTNVMIIGFDKAQGKIKYKVNYSQPSAYTRIASEPHNYFYMVKQQADGSQKVIKIDLNNGSFVVLGGDLKNQNVHMISVTKTDKVFFMNTSNNIVVFTDSSNWQNAVTSPFPGVYADNSQRKVLAFCATSDNVFYTLFSDYKLLKTDNNTHTTVATINLLTNYYVKNRGSNAKQGISTIVPGNDNNDIVLLGYSNALYTSSNNTRLDPAVTIDGVNCYYYNECTIYHGGSYLCHYDYSKDQYKQTEIDGIDATSEFINNYSNIVKINDQGTLKLSLSYWLEGFAINLIDSEGNLLPVQLQGLSSAGNYSVIGSFGTRLINSWVATSNKTYGKTLCPLYPTYGNVTNNITGGDGTTPGTTASPNYVLTVIKGQQFNEVVYDKLVNAQTVESGITVKPISVTKGTTTKWYTLLSGTLTDADITADNPTKGIIVNDKLVVFIVINPPSISSQTATLEFN